MTNIYKYKNIDNLIHYKKTNRLNNNNLTESRFILIYWRGMNYTIDRSSLIYEMLHETKFIKEHQNTDF